MQRARKLVRAERAHRAGTDPGKSNMDEKILGFARIRAGYYTLQEEDPEQVELLVSRVNEYDADLQALGIEDHELDRAAPLQHAALASLLVLQLLTLFLLLPPVLIIGWVVNAPAAGVLILFAKALSKRKKDEATAKLLLGALLLPLSWAGAGVLAFWGHSQLHAVFPTIPATPVLAAVMVVLLAIVGGGISVRYLRVTRGAARSVRVRLTRAIRKRSIERLKKERSELHDQLIEVSSHMPLPGAVADDGKIVARSPAP
jgi:hypothetical protein